MKNHRLYTIMLFLVLIFPVSGEGWYNSQWESRFKIVINTAHKDFHFLKGTLEDFPVPVIPGKNERKLLNRDPEGGFFFTAADGVSPLPFEVEYSGGEAGLFWVRLPEISAMEETVIFLYYGAPGARNSQNSSGVWAGNYTGVWHLGEGSSFFVDSVSSRAFGYGSLASQPGLLGRGLEIKGQGDSVYFENLFSTSSREISLELWFRSDDVQQDAASSLLSHRAFSLALNSSNPSLSVRLHTDQEQGAGPEDSSIQILPGTWNHSAFTWSAEDELLKVYLNGQRLSASAVTIKGRGLYSAGDSDNLVLGNSSSAQEESLFTGMLDELRLSDKSLSAEWIRVSSMLSLSPERYTVFTQQFSVNGRLYKDAGGLPVGESSAVTLSAGGKKYAETYTDERGEFTFVADRAAVPPGTHLVLTAGDGGAVQGVRFATAGENGLGALDIWMDYVITGNEQGSAVEDSLLLKEAVARGEKSGFPLKREAGRLIFKESYSLYIPEGVSFVQSGDIFLGGGEDSNLIIDGQFSAAAALFVGGDLSGQGLLQGGLADITVAGDLAVRSYQGARSTTVKGDWLTPEFSHNKGEVFLDGDGLINSGEFYSLTLLSGERLLAGDLSAAGELVFLGGSLASGNNVLKVAGNWDDSRGGFASYQGTVILTGSDVTVVQNEFNHFYNLVIENICRFKGPVNIAGNITINGKLYGGEHRIEVAGDWRNNGGFEAGSSVVAFIDSSKESRFSGSSRFHTLSCSESPGKILSFEGDSLQTVTGFFDVSGSQELPVSLIGTGNRSWSLLLQEDSPEAKYVYVRDSVNRSDRPVAAGSSIDGGRNKGWEISPPGIVVTWVGGAGAERSGWHVPANWRPRRVPDEPGEIALIPGNVRYMPELGGDIAVGGVVIQEGAVLDTGGFNLEIGDMFVNRGTLRRKAGSRISRNDTGSGSVVYYGIQSGVSGEAVIQDYGFIDYHDLVLAAPGITFVPEGEMVVDGILSLTGGALRLKEKGLVVENGLETGEGASLYCGRKLLKVNGDMWGAGFLYGETAVIRIEGDLNIRNCQGSSASLVVAGAWGVRNFEHNKGEVVLFGSGTVQEGRFYNLSITRGSRKLAGDLVVEKELSVREESLLIQGDRNILVEGNLLGAGKFSGGSGSLDVRKNILVEDFTAPSGILYPGGALPSGKFFHNGGTTVIRNKTVLQEDVRFGFLKVEGTLVPGEHSVFIDYGFENQGIVVRSTGGFFEKNDRDSGTVVYRGDGFIQNYEGVDYHNLELTEGIFLLTDELSVSGDMNLSSGELDLNGHTLSVGGSWISGETSLSGDGIVEFFDPTRDSVIQGDNVFPSLKCTAPGKILRFAGGKSRSVTGDLILQGSPAAPVHLTGEGPWELTLNKAQQVEFISIENSGGIPINGYDVTARFSGYSSGEAPEGWVFSGKRFIWTGSQGSEWESADNWEPVSQGGPGRGDCAVIPGGASVMPRLTGGEYKVAELYIAPGAVLDIGKSQLYISSRLENRGTLRRELMSYPFSGPKDSYVSQGDGDSGRTLYYGEGSYVQDYGDTDYYILELESGSITLAEGLSVAGDWIISGEGTAHAGSYPVVLRGSLMSGELFAGGAGAPFSEKADTEAPVSEVPVSEAPVSEAPVDTIAEEAADFEPEEEEGPELLVLTTTDSNGDGYIDRIDAGFSKPVAASTVNPVDFIISHGEILSITDNRDSDDAVLWIHLKEGELSTAAVPLLSLAEGCVKDFSGRGNLPASEVPSVDTSPPVLLSVSGTAGEQRLLLRFSEPVFSQGDTPLGPEVFAAQGSRAFTIRGLNPLAEEGLYSLELDAPLTEEDFQAGSIGIKELFDGAGNRSSGINGFPETFREMVPPVAEEVVTRDSNGNGFIDGVEIRFSGPVYDKSLSAADFDVVAVDGETFRTEGEPVNDNTVFLSFRDNVLSSAETPVIRYTGSSLVDTALNRISFPGPLASKDGASPVILYTLAVAGYNRILVRFSEPVTSGGLRFSPRDFHLKSHAVKEVETPAPSELLLLLDEDIEPVQVIQGELLTILESRLFDTRSNALVLRTHRISDMALGFMEPLRASDLDPGEGFPVEDVSSFLQRFDGNGWLRERDVLLEAASYDTAVSSLDTVLFFNLSSPSKGASFRQPEDVAGFCNSARPLAPVLMAGYKRNFLFSSDESDFKEGATVEFLFKIGDLYCTRVADPLNPASLMPWSFQIKNLERKASGVIIRNTEINPALGEEVAMEYVLRAPGRFSVTVLNLRGEVVKKIFEGNRDDGIHKESWKGDDESGQPVGRGVYFITLKGAGIDQTAKILVTR